MKRHNHKKPKVRRPPIMQDFRNKRRGIAELADMIAESERRDTERQSQSKREDR